MIRTPEECTNYHSAGPTLGMPQPFLYLRLQLDQILPPPCEPSNYLSSATRNARIMTSGHGYHVSVCVEL